MKTKLMQVYKRGGLFAVLKKSFEVLSRILGEVVRNLYFRLMPAAAFCFNGVKLRYFRHSYNLAYQNERTVEISIASWFLNGQGKASKVLEVGNVLGNYGCRVKRDVLDKYDLSPNIINEDVVSFRPKEKYNAIVSISTLEHVGWDEADRDPEKIPTAVKNLKESCLLPGGVMLVSLPLGYNSYFDDYIKHGAPIFSEKYFLKRISADNKWKEVEYCEVADSKFGAPFNNANAMFIGVVKN